MIDIGSFVVVVKGKKVPVGTTGTVFWKKKYDCYCGTFGLLRIGIKSDEGKTYFIDANQTREIKENENKN